MALAKEKIQAVISEYGANEKDTGSTEAQIALLTEKILALSAHMREHKKDFHSQRGLLKMVGQRKRMLSYLERKDYEGYKALIGRLGLRR